MSKQKYKYLVVMNNGNKYEIVTDKSPNLLLKYLYGNSKVNITSSELLNPIGQYSAIVTNSEYISEILYGGVVNE